MMAILTGIRGYIIVILILISLIISGIEYLCMCLFASIYPLLRNVYLDLLLFFFFFCYLLFWYWVAMSCLYILEFVITLFTTIFSHSEGYLFILFMVSFVVQQPLSLIRSHDPATSLLGIYPEENHSVKGHMCPNSRIYNSQDMEAT